ncbi:unnamed protein product [Schistosoma mattheei]|uniref:Uncharacterized protein n=1 Tax=Schistosoma mattheei TaxID=31246 RepID=A0A183PUB2_9TREM|nr:unnamed protein product [Schistosoma mattheei]
MAHLTRFFSLKNFPYSPDDIHCLTEIFSKMFADSQSKVVSLFMDTLQFFIKEYNPLLRDWLYTLLIRLLYRQSHEALSSHQKAIQETLFVLRSHFPLNSQFISCCHFIMDNAHTPNFRVKTCLLEYMKDLILMMSPDLIANPSNEVINAIGKIISWSAEPKSADVRRVIRVSSPRKPNSTNFKGCAITVLDLPSYITDLATYNFIPNMQNVRVVSNSAEGNNIGNNKTALNPDF